MSEKHYIGESKLLSLGFIKRAERVYVLRKKIYDKVRKRLFEKDVATVEFGKDGYIKRTIGVNKDHTGKPMLYWRR